MITFEQIKKMRNSFPGINDPRRLEEYISEVLDIMQVACQDERLNCDFDDENFYRLKVEVGDPPVIEHMRTVDSIVKRIRIVLSGTSLRTTVSDATLAKEDGQPYYRNISFLLNGIEYGGKQ